MIVTKLKYFRYAHADSRRAMSRTAVAAIMAPMIRGNPPVAAALCRPSSSPIVSH
jgi:hypothetical protein